MRERDVELERERQSRDALETALRTAGGEILSGGAVRCPFHDDRSASGSIHRDQAGVWRYTCHASSCAWSGDVIDLRAQEAGTSAAELLRERRQRMTASTPPFRPPGQARTERRVFADVAALQAAVPGEHEQTFRYSNPDTHAVELVVLRYRRREDGKKAFWQASPDGNGGFVLGAPPKPWPLYNRARVREASRVVVVEGEKCVHQLHDLGMVATTAPCGAGKAAHADWRSLAGKQVVLWPDHDPAGQEHMREVLSILQTLTPPVRLSWVDPEQLGIPEKGDVCDFCTSLPPDTVARDIVLRVIEAAEPVGAAAAVGELLESMIEGRWQCIDWPWKDLTLQTRALLPGKVTLLCGMPDTTKSFFLLEALGDWHSDGINVAVYELEEDRTYHLYRALAQKSMCGSIFDDKWVKQNPDRARAYFTKHAEWLDTFGRCIWEVPAGKITLSAVADWIEERAREGRRIIAVDPVTVATGESRSPWVDDLDFVLRVKAIAQRYGCSLILVTHPRKGSKQFGLDDIAGGAAYTRFSHTVLYFDRYTHSQKIKVMDGVEKVEQSINRAIHVKKARNGPGNGMKIGYMFYGEALRFIERGVEMPE